MSNGFSNFRLIIVSLMDSKSKLETSAQLIFELVERLKPLLGLRVLMLMTLTAPSYREIHLIWFQYFCWLFGLFVYCFDPRLSLVVYCAQKLFKILVYGKLIMTIMLNVVVQMSLFTMCLYDERGDNICFLIGLISKII